MAGRDGRVDWRAAAIDVGPAVTLAVVGVLDIATGLSQPTGTAAPVTALAPTLIVCGALLLRRRVPLLALAIALSAIVVPIWVAPVALSYWGEFVPWLLALYSCSRHESRIARAMIALALSAAVLAAISVRFPEMGDVGDVLYNGAFLAAAWALGLFGRSWAVSRDKALRAELERSQVEAQARQRERARIARELHDIIAHTITVIVMQAGGARLASASDPAIATSTLAQIEELGRSSLAELRSLLPLLREGEDEPSTVPQPTLDDVAELCDRMRGLGLPVDLRLDDGLGEVPLGLQLTGYRVVQEGLTNVIKHAGMVETAVRVSRDSTPAALTIDVRTRIPADGPRAAAPGAGRGLLGLRERVRIAGGTFSAGPSDDDGYTLHVELPIGVGVA